MTALPSVKMWPGKWQFAAVLVAGLALALALPPVGLWPVMPVSLAVLAAVVEPVPAGALRRHAAFGFTFGLGYFVAALHWIGAAFFVDAATDLWMMPFAVGGLAMMMACYWALALAASGALRRWQVPLWLSIPATLALAEWLRGVLFTGFPWAAPGLAADGMGSVVQLASLIGMEGLTWLVLLWALVPLALWQGYTARAGVGLLALTLPLALLWGAWRVPAVSLPAGAPVVRLVQPNISQSDKWRGDHAEEILGTLLALSAQKGPQRPSLIVWPESSVPFLLDEIPTALGRIAAVLGEGRTLAAGSIRREASGEEGGDRYFTSILTIDGTGAVTGRYDKWRLVPGGEFLPFESLLGPLGFRKVVPVPDSFTPGPGPRSLPVAGVGLAGMMICYEAIFPHHLVEGERPRLFINVTNDGWFGQSVGPYQHLAQVRLRAIEQGLPVARAANTGISAVFDSYGRMVASSQLGTRTIVDAALPERGMATIFATYGQWPIFGLLFIVSVALGRWRRKIATSSKAS